MIEINGSEGEGGGQIVRSSIALAAVTGQAVRITNIRGGRKKPGLLRQHLAGVRAITQICRAKVSGADLGSCQLTLEPGSITGGDYRFEVGSSGSAVLVAQTILPALMAADAPSTVNIGGGTHAAWAPPFDFFERCYLPLVARMGGNVSTSLSAYGFYPAGGGRIEIQIDPTTSMNGLVLTERMGTVRPRVTAVVSKVPTSVGDRECDVIARKANWDRAHCNVAEAHSSGGPGNVVMIELSYDNVNELVIGFGKVGLKAEHVARSTLREARDYLAQPAPVGEYLADQLLLPMGIATRGGHSSEFVTGPLSLHSRTHIDVMKRFLDVDVRSAEQNDQSVRVIVSPAAKV